MSTAKRLISGSAASWARIGITILTQVALVPIFLSYWDVKTYGFWIAIQALVNVLSTFDRGHNDFLEYEFLKIGPEQREKIGFLLSSGIAVTILIGIVELIMIGIACFLMNVGVLLGEGEIQGDGVRSQIGSALFIQWISWTLTNLIGLYFRALSAYGYFPRVGWWNVLLAIVSSMIPVLSVVNGGNLVTASIGAMVGTMTVLLFQYLDIVRLLKKERISQKDKSLKVGFGNYKTSFGLSFRYFLDNFKQQGVRLILAPLSGMVGLAAFSTTRTVANVTQQGLLTVTHPLMPELMRFLRHKEQEKMEASFGTVWFVLVSFLAPLVLVLQVIAPPFFSVWTKGQIEFHPLLFASLSLGVLFFAYAQPAMAVLVGNNLLRQQMLISIVSTLTVIIVTLLSVPYMGILGAGLALLAAELVGAVGFIRYAGNWLTGNHLYWPEKAANIASVSVWIAAISMGAVSVFPQVKWPVLCLGLVLLIWNARRYWMNLPLLVLQRVYAMTDKLSILTKMI